MSIRRYSNLAPPLPLMTGVNTTAPTLAVSSTSGYPEPPFELAIDRGTLNEEVCLCTAKTGTTFTVSRGFDDTSGKNHDPGAFVEHVHSAIEFRESKIVRLTTGERDALFANEVWDGRLIWNSTTEQYEFRDPQGPGSVWASLFPAGLTLPFAGSVLPPGWVWAQGQELNRADYSKLFAAVGVVFGAGNGSTTFNVPDMRRRLPLGRHDTAPYNVLGAFGGGMDHVHTNPPATSAGAHQHTQAATGSAGTHTHPTGSTGSSGNLNTTGAIKFTNPGGHTFDAIADNVDQAEEHVHTLAGHTHPIADPSSAGAHTHTNPAVTSAGAHTHTIGNTGTANPPHLVLNYIVKT